MIPTRGELLGQTPLLDFTVELPRSMTRREWRLAGYLVKPRQVPIRKERQEQGKFYGGTWHPWEVGIYGKHQVITIEEHEANKHQREASKEASEDELLYLRRLKGLKEREYRLYDHVYQRAKAEGTDTVITNNNELRAACRIRRNDFKSHRDELVARGLIQYRLTHGRQSKITVTALLAVNCTKCA